MVNLDDLKLVKVENASKSSSLELGLELDPNSTYKIKLAFFKFFVFKM